jgi:hypothetical protein
MSDEQLFEQLAQAAEAEREQGGEAAPSTLKSRLFSMLNQLQAAEGGLEGVDDCRARGGDLCVFEQLVAVAPVGHDLKTKNPCRVCHARVLGENVEGAPIYWEGCPYVQFQNR